MMDELHRDTAATTEIAPPVRGWKRVKWTRAGQVAPLLAEPGMVGAVHDLTPAAAFAQLRAASAVDATMFIAQCLPKMDAVLWASACLPPEDAATNPARRDAARAVRRWTADPSDGARRHAYAQGGNAGWDTAEGALCLAVFLSGGSMAPPEQSTAVPPPPGAFGQAVAASVQIAAQSDGPVAAPSRLARLLDLADATAAGEPLSAEARA